jgi:Carboxypeptidase regulatory-like domain/TonB-dependent Receptor Plug Domain
MKSKWVIIMLSLVLGSATGWAQQSTGTITGAVYDSSGALIPGAKITVKNLSTNFTWNGVTTNSGEYQVSFLPAGTYEIAAEAEGFTKTVRTGITLSASETVRADLTLKVGQVTQQVTVEADATPVATESADVGNTVSGTQTRELPLSTRQFIQMLTLEPGVSSDIGSQPGFASLSTAAVSVNGMRENQNNYLIDGVNNIDTYNGNNMVTPNLEALAEFRVSRASYSAESGRSAGATINLITRSGSNRFHGSAFEFLRNDKLNARNFFDLDQADPTTGEPMPGTARPKNRYNNFGYTLGGPIKKDKLFFFWSQEYRRIIQSSGTTLTYVPTAAEKSGVFNQTLLNTAGKTTPEGAPCVTSADGVSTIDPSCINSTAVLLLNTYWPNPNPAVQQPGFNYVSSVPDFTKTREELFRMDYKPTDKLTIFGRYTQDNDSIHSPYGLWHENPIPNEGASDEFEPLQNAALNVTYSFSPSIINEAQYSYDHNLIRISEAASASRARAAGLDIPYLFPSNAQGNAENRIPSIYLYTGNYASINIIWPFRNTYFYSKFTDNLSWVKGKHNFKFGALLTRQGKGEDNVPDNQNGTFQFDGRGTHDPNDISTVPGNAVADMLLNYAASYSENPTKPHQILRYWDFEAYAQDTFRVTPHLTLNYGLRYSLYTAEHDMNGLLANFDPALYSPAKAPVVDTWGSILSPIDYNYLNGIYVASNAPIPSQYQSDVLKSPYGQAIYSPGKLNFAPRLGFAYDVFHNQKTSLRGGYGMYYDRWAPYTLWMKNTPPFNYPESVSLTELTNPAAGSVNGEGVVWISNISPKFSVPYAQQWSLGVQQEIMRDTVVDVSYVGSKGTHLLRTRNLNQAVNPNLDVEQGNAGGYDLMPYQGFGGITYFETSADSSYHSLQISLNRRFVKGVSFQAAYTWSKTITNADNDAATPQNSYDVAADRGLASFDRPQMLTFNYVWELPFAKGLKGPAGKLLDGWVVSGITSFNSGNAYTVYATSGFSGVAGAGSERADRVAGQTVSGPKTITDYFNTAAFVDPAPLTYGNSMYGAVRGPGTNNWDISLGKNTKIRESVNLQFRAEFLNTFNHASFNGISTYIGSGAFGEVTGARDGRLIQMGLKLQF